MSLSLTVTDAAAKTVRESAADSTQTALRITISPSFQYDLQLDAARPDDVVVAANGITLVFDAGSAQRAEGLILDFDDRSGGGFTIDNPNTPVPIEQITAEDLRALLAGDEVFELLDVRTPGERAIAMIKGSRLLDQALHDELMSGDRNTPLVFQCHHGVRSQSAAEHFQRAGFRRLYNLQGGIDAWSLQVDPSVPRY